jgi:membrane-associated phospholipid phosphatase
LSKKIDYPWKLHCLILTPLLAVIFTIGILHGFFGDQPQIFFEMLSMQYPSITKVMWVLSKYSSMTLYLVYFAMLAYGIVNRDNEINSFVLRFIILAIIFNVLLVHLLKFGFGVPRPGNGLQLQPFSFLNAYASFPSGHTTAVITAALPLALWVGRKEAYIFLSLLITGVGFSRLWLEAHHPVDILGGIVLGSLAARFIFYRYGQLKR